MRSLTLLVALLICGSSIGQIEEVRRITETLCSPEFHGRGYVNKGDSVAAAFLADEFKKLGAEPYKGNYFQRFQLNVNTFPGAMSLKQGDRNLVPGKDFVIDPNSGGTNGTSQELKCLLIPKEKSMDAPYLVEVLQKMGKNEISENCLVFDFSHFKGDSLKEVRGIASELAMYLPVIALIDTKFTWSVGREQVFKLFFQIRKEAFGQEMELVADIDARYIPTYDSQNVMAYIPSKRKKAKTVMFTAHYDHLGRMGADTYFPGANDNASGTAMLLTMAKHFMENPSKHNLLFVAFAGEEAGLVGSKYFVDNTPIDLSTVKFLVNLDIMGSGEEGITVVNATEHMKAYKRMVKINKKKDLLTRVKKRGPTSNSDHYWFTTKGVPAFFIYTMGPNKHYHDVFDTYDELTFNEYDDITTLLIDFVKRVR